MPQDKDGPTSPTPRRPQDVPKRPRSSAQRGHQRDPKWQPKKGFRSPRESFKEPRKKTTTTPKLPKTAQSGREDRPETAKEPRPPRGGPRGPKGAPKNPPAFFQEVAGRGAKKEEAGGARGENDAADKDGGVFKTRAGTDTKHDLLSVALARRRGLPQAAGCLGAQGAGPTLSADPTYAPP